MLKQRTEILVVDDTRVNRMILEVRLAENGFTVTAASNGREALDLLDLSAGRAAPRFDAVVLDIMMPEIDGMTVLETVRRHHSPIELPIIMATAIDQSADIVACLSLGANDYVSKPVDIDVLCARLSTQIELSRSHRSLRQAQQSLLHAAKMESIGYLAAGVAHEIRNPLAKIQMVADCLREEFGSPEDDDTKMLIDTMVEAVKRADEIVKGLMQFSSTSRLALKDDDLNALVESTVGLVRAEGEAAGVSIKCHLDPAIPQARFAREDLSQATINVLVNAIQAARQGGGNVVVRTGSEVLTGLDVDEGARTGNLPRNGELAVSLVIEDDGPGIAEDKLMNVFDAFYTTRPTGAGTGLGLTVTRKIIELHEGLIRVENREDGPGARVIILLKAKGSIATMV